MNLHIFSDTFGLYPSYVVQNVEKYCSLNNAIFVNITESMTVECKDIQLISMSVKKQKAFVHAMDKPVDKIIFHPYTTASYIILKLLQVKYPTAKLYWVHWSYELYNLPSNYLNILAPFSKKYFLSQQSFFKRLLMKTYDAVPDAIKNLRYQAQDKAIVTEKKFKSSFHAFDEFYALLHHDYLYLVNNFYCPQIQHKPFAYLALEKMIPNLLDEANPGNSIMLGHSAGIDGNHYEMISQIADYTLSQQLLIPLTYGDEKYKRLIASYALQKFDKLEILDKKLPPELYYKKLKEVGFCIINVKVQQGIGNITALLWYGVKVFLCKKSSTYKDFKQLNLHIFSIEDDLSAKALSTKLSASEISNNRFILKNLLSDSKLAEYWANFK